MTLQCFSSPMTLPCFVASTSDINSHTLKYPSLLPTLPLSNINRHQYIACVAIWVPVVGLSDTCIQQTTPRSSLRTSLFIRWYFTMSSCISEGGRHYHQRFKVHYYFCTTGYLLVCLGCQRKIRSEESRCISEGGRHYHQRFKVHYYFCTTGYLLVMLRVSTPDPF